MYYIYSNLNMNIKINLCIHTYIYICIYIHIIIFHIDGLDGLMSNESRANVVEYLKQRIEGIYIYIYILTYLYILCILNVNYMCVYTCICIESRFKVVEF
jgi:hypothetical protein